MTSQKHDIIILSSGLAGLLAATEAVHNSGLAVAIVSKVVNRWCERPPLRRDNDEDSKYQVTTQ
jgi:thioredoxin reductase